MYEAINSDEDSIFSSMLPFFRASDRLRLEGYSNALINEGKSLSIVSTHEAILDHYLNLLLARLRQVSPGLTSEVYFPASSEALLTRFNEALSDCSIQEAMADNATTAQPKIWIVHDASALPDHEIQLLARLVQNFPGANIRVILLISIASQKQKLLKAFARRILCWDVEPPTTEQADIMMQQAIAGGKESSVRSLLMKIKIAEASKLNSVDLNAVESEISLEEPGFEIQDTFNRPKRFRVFLIAIFVLLFSIASVLVFQSASVEKYFTAKSLKELIENNSNIFRFGSTKLIQSVPQAPLPNVMASTPQPIVTMQAPIIDEIAQPVEVKVKVKEVLEDIPAVLPEVTKVQQANVVTKVLPVQDLIAKTQKVDVASKEGSSQEISSPDLQIGQAWVKRMPRGTFLVQHVALPSVQEALQWVQKHPILKNARVVATYLPYQKETQYAIVSGPFSSLGDATAFAGSGGLPKDPMIRSARFMKEQFSPEQADADATKRRERKR